MCELWSPESVSHELWTPTIKGLLTHYNLIFSFKYWFKNVLLWEEMSHWSMQKWIAIMTWVLVYSFFFYCCCFSITRTKMESFLIMNYCQKKTYFFLFFSNWMHWKLMDSFSSFLFNINSCRIGLQFSTQEKRGSYKNCKVDQEDNPVISKWWSSIQSWL